MTKTSFVVDSQTLAEIESLKSVFGVQSNGEVLQKALSLSRVVGRHADKNNNVVIAGNDELTKLNLAT